MILKALIIDDEKDSREILSNYLTKYCPEIKVSGFGENVSTGLEAIRHHKPDVVFLDIEMPFGTGFDLLDQIPNIDFEIVFVTAYDHYAIKALNQSAAYYLLKPLDIDDLIKAVEKIKKEREQGNYPEHAKILAENIRHTTPERQKIMLPTLEGYEIIPIGAIVYCEADDNLTRFHLDEQKPLLICHTLKHFDEILQDHGFIRIHRSYLINPTYLVRYTKGKGGFVTLKNGKELEVSSNKKKTLLDFFKK